jgi:AhpD family alkylhydroperoxidase
MSDIMSPETTTMSGGTKIPFPDHTIESAPSAARRSMTAVRDNWGYLPSGVARLATSPHILDGFLRLNGIFESCTLDQLAREVLVMTVATRNGCHLCVAIHTRRLTAMDADPDLIAALRDSALRDSALRDSAPLADPRLEAIRVFTHQVLDTAGDVGDEALEAFLAQGYTAQNALEVVLGVGTYTLSTLANRLTGAQLDKPLAEFAWHA